MTARTLNGLIPKPTASRPGPDFNGHNTAHLEVLRQHHANLVRMLKSLEEFNDLLHEVYTKKIVDQATYEKFLMKQESNPHCSSTVLSGLLLLDIRKNLEEKPHLFKSFCECVEKVDPDCTKKLKGSVYFICEKVHKYYYALHCSKWSTRGSTFSGSTCR